MGFRWLPGRFALLAGVEPHEVLQVLGSKRRRPVPIIDPHGLPKLAIYGRTETGRGLTVVLQHDEGLDWIIVGAREMTAAETAAYDEWEAR